MKNCNDIQHALRDRFDLGEAFDGFADDHVAECGQCRSYRTDLMLLKDELGVFEMEIAPEDLCDRIVQHVRDHVEDHGLRYRDYAVIATITCAGSMLAGRYLPTLIEPLSWWPQIRASMAQVDGTYAATMLMDRIAVLRMIVDDSFSGLPVVSQSILWQALAVSCAAALVFNGFVAMRMRTAGD